MPRATATLPVTASFQAIEHKGSLLPEPLQKEAGAAAVISHHSYAEVTTQPHLHP